MGPERTLVEVPVEAGEKLGETGKNGKRDRRRVNINYVPKLSNKRILQRNF